MKSGFWYSLLHIPALEAVYDLWNKHSGDDFKYLQSFIIPTTKKSHEYLCVNNPSCSCNHEVVVHASKRIVAVCRCESYDCEPIQIETKDIIIYTIDLIKFTRSISEAFGFKYAGNTQSYFSKKLVSVGKLANSDIKVFFLLCQIQDNIIDYIEKLISMNPDPLILLIPSAEIITPTVQSLLLRSHIMLIDVSEYLAFRDSKKILISKSIQPLIDKYQEGLMLDSELPKHIERIDRNIDLVAKGKYDLEKENDELKNAEANGLFNFLTKVSADDFRYFIAICMHGDRAKAAKALSIKVSTFYGYIEKWKTKDLNCQRMYRMIGAFKNLKAKNVSMPASLLYSSSGGKNENPSILEHALQKMKNSQNGSVYPNIFQEVLGAFKKMNANNWEAIKAEVIPLLKEELS